MIVILLGGLALAGASVALVARAVAMPRVRSAETVEQIGAYGFARPHTEQAPRGTGMWSALDGLATLLGGIVATRLGGLRESELRNELMAAGLYTMTPRKFVGYRILALVCTPVAWVYSTTTAGFPVGVMLLGSFCALLAGWTAPLTIVRKRARRRLERIDYELPELIDLLIVTVEAGLGFSSSLQIAADRIEGPLGDELRLSLQEQRMGLSIMESLTNMLGRADTPAMRSFVRSILQGETLGVSIGDIMRALADEMRKRRRAAAEERAQKAPIKILFPLVFLIFPAMFVVLLGPAFFSFMDAFGGS
jgi:tight adherence protein C